MLAAAVACVVGLLCAASFDISGVPEVDERAVLALFACCVPFALKPFAGAHALLTQQDASCEPQIAPHTTPKQALKSCYSRYSWDSSCLKVIRYIALQGRA